jgi:hypothetical protein
VPSDPSDLFFVKQRSICKNLYEYPPVFERLEDFLKAWMEETLPAGDARVHHAGFCSLVNQVNPLPRVQLLAVHLLFFQANIAHRAAERAARRELEGTRKRYSFIF